jgi:hypothetical protein
MTPITQMRARGIDTFWTATHRREAQDRLAYARESTWRAEWYFDIAARELEERGKYCERLASDYIDLAFRCIESARADRRRAKEAALLATRGTPLEAWVGKTAGRAERRRIVIAYRGAV